MNKTESYISGKL